MAEAVRIKAIDWLRGVAVLVMVQTHSLALLRPDLRQTPLFGRLQWVDGLVAPSFILAAGFSLALVQVRGAASGGRGRRFVRSLRRVIEVLLVASYMTWLWFPVRQEPHWLLRIDILGCIGATLLLALPLFAALAARPKLLCAASYAVGVAVLMTAPYLQRADGLAGRLLNPTMGSTFPMAPWAAYVFLGGSLGALAAAGDARRMQRWLCVLVATGVGIWFATDALKRGQPPVRWWISNNHAERVVVVGLIALALVELERALAHRISGSAPVRFLDVFGSSSLAAYVSHEVLLFTPIFGFCFSRLWKASAGWELYWTLTAVLIAATFVCTWIAGRLYAWADRPIEFGERGLVGRGVRRLLSPR